MSKLAPAATSLADDALPLGLANRTTLANPVKTGSVVSWRDVKGDETHYAVRARRQMEPARWNLRPPFVRD